MKSEVLGGIIGTALVIGGVGAAEVLARGVESVYDLGVLNGEFGFVADSASHVTIIGDVNADGYGDFILDTVLIYGGPSIAPTGTFDSALIDGVDGVRFIEEKDGDQLGTSHTAADINHDGFVDLFIGARGADPLGKTNAGQAYVLYGGTGFGAAQAQAMNSVFFLSNLDGVVGFDLLGGTKSDQFGFSMSGGDDVNADGADDVVIGAPFAKPDGQTATGRVHVVFGGAGVGASGSITPAELPASQSFTIHGVDEFGAAGRSVALVGDVNGDAAADILIGAPDATGGDTSPRGEAYLVFGGPGVGAGGPVELAQLNGADGFRVSGAQTNDEFGHAVCAAGDFDGDGYDDVAIAARGSDVSGDNAGRVVLLFGSATVGATGVVFIQQLTGSNGFSVVGSAAEDQLGGRLAFAGDVNLDGLGDIWFSASSADPDGLVNAGQTYVLYGGTVPGGAVFAVDALDGQNGKRIPGLEPQEFVGSALAAGGDVNGDLRPDLFLDSAKALYVIFDITRPSPLAVEPRDISVSTGGVQTVCIEPGPAHAGRSYIFFGSTFGTFPTTQIQGFTLNLTWDAYFSFLFTLPNPPHFPKSLGVLDANGSASAQVFIPPAVATPFVGLELFHAYVVFDPGTGIVHLASNTTKLVLTP